MSWLYDEVEKGRAYAALIALLLGVRKFLSTQVRTTPETEALIHRITEFTRRPL